MSGAHKAEGFPHKITAIMFHVKHDRLIFAFD